MARPEESNGFEKQELIKMKLNPDDSHYGLNFSMTRRSAPVETTGLRVSLQPFTRSDRQDPRISGEQSHDSQDKNQQTHDDSTGTPKPYF
jgi:hypothetical protein